MRDVTRQPAGRRPLREAEHHKDEAGQTFHFPKINAEKQSLDFPPRSVDKKGNSDGVGTIFIMS